MTIDRRFATLLFTDIVESARGAAELGDRRWRSPLGFLASVRGHAG